MKIMTIDKKKYILKRAIHDKGEDTLELVPYDKGDYDKVVGEIVKAVKKKVNPEEAVKAGLANLEWEEIQAIHKALYKKKQKPRSERGCYQISIGRHTIPLVE